MIRQMLCPVHVGGFLRPRVSVVPELCVNEPWVCNWEVRYLAVDNKFSEGPEKSNRTRCARQ